MSHARYLPNLALMPRATMIHDDITDHVVPLEDLGGLLLALTTAPVIEPGNGVRPPLPA